MFALGFITGSWLVVAVVIVTIAAAAYGLFTVRGSGISLHPHDGGDGAPGAEGADDPAGLDHSEASAFETRGTK